MSSLHDDNEIAKPYLTEAPYLIIVMKQTHSYFDDEKKTKRTHYYPKESCGIASGSSATQCFLNAPYLLSAERASKINARFF